MNIPGSNLSKLMQPWQVFGRDGFVTGFGSERDHFSVKCVHINIFSYDCLAHGHTVVQVPQVAVAVHRSRTILRESHFEPSLLPFFYWSNSSFRDPVGF